MLYFVIAILALGRKGRLFSSVFFIERKVIYDYHIKNQLKDIFIYSCVEIAMKIMIQSRHELLLETEEIRFKNYIDSKWNRSYNGQIHLKFLGMARLEKYQTCCNQLTCCLRQLVIQNPSAEDLSVWAFLNC